ncbi:uncharacterized protein NECHADRAFT_76228 [Fusarium vanettenii 77-13-4]|uniref:Uncharacterized protein n=1 Tax=Fusarium vanettenii (strain ATCC MYA-4622 / CBS 123669 / FGSC 9596 / NRRL 45880 / 77-13-4) TaxID=660122 RepID=C7Z6W0_FUSV7|nr:uncharacterized protein NECHADRAFT_76228 [Fusarium vanettenii 77-13-4]EEU40765.1 hypothetical protein NECHADRAFT_76228 [Fusarium vanettenii 77-13-4]
MPSRRNTAAGQPGMVTPTDTPLRQTRARSKLNNAPQLMTGLDHRGRAKDPLATDPENIIFDDVVRKLRRKKKIIFRHRCETPESPTDNVKAAKRAQLKKKAAASVASSSHSRFSSSDPDSDGGVPLYTRSSSSDSDGGVPLTSRSPPESSSDPDSDGGVPLNSPSQSSSSSFESGRATYGDTDSPLSRGSPWSSGASRRSGASHHSHHSGSGSDPSGAGASAPLEDDNPGEASQPRSSPSIRGTPNQPEPGERLPPRAPHPTPDPDAGEDTPMEDGIEPMKSLPLRPSKAVQGYEFRDWFASRLGESPTMEPSPEDVKLTTVNKRGRVVAAVGDSNPPALSGDDDDEPPRRATRRPRRGCAADSLRKRRRSKDDGSAPQTAKKRRVEEPISFSRTFSLPFDDGESDIGPDILDRVDEESNDVFYSPESIPVTEQTDINPIPSPVLTTTKIPGLAFLETQNVSITTDNASPKVLTPIEPPADFDSEIPGLYGSGKRPRLHYDWYEQYHRFGPDCQKVHGCKHGQFCHECHADWHKAWSHFFKRQDEVDAEVAATANYDIRKGYLGTALGFEHAPKPVIEPIPPRGGKIRTHPARIAKEKLALMKKMAESG